MRKIALGALILFLAASFMPLGWNKFDIVSHAGLIYATGILTAIFAVVLGRRSDEAVKTSYNFKFLSLLALFFILVVISLFTSEISNYGWSEVLIWGFAITLFAVTQTFSEKERKILKIALVAFTLISCAIAFITYLTRPENRMAGTFFDLTDIRHIWPNAFALLLLMIWPVAADLTKEKKWYLRILILAPIFTCLFLTFSRAAMIAFAIQLIIICLFLHPKSYILHPITSYKLKAKSYKLFPILLTTILLTTSLQYARSLHFNTNSFQKKITFEGTEKQTSLQERLNFFKGGIELSLERPFFGYGPGTFRFIYPKVQTDFLANSDHPHNIFIKIAAENGIPAAATLLIFFIFFIYDFWKHSEKPQALKRIQPFADQNRFLFAAVLGALAHNLVDYNLNFLTNITIFWILAALAIPERAAPLETPPKSYKLKARSYKLLAPLLLLTTALTEATIHLTSHLTKNPEIMKYAQFPRDFWANKNEEKDLQYHLSLNPLDAYAWNNLGKIQQKAGNKKSALESYKKAVLTNPANNFEFYTNYFQLASQFPDTKSDTQKITETALKFLQQYPEKVRYNVHYTANSGNFQQAIALANLLHQPELAEKIEESRSER